MPKDEWGVKRACPKCTTRFYDLQKDPMTCPSCGAEFTLESLTAPTGRGSGSRAAERAPQAAAAAVVGEKETDDETDEVDVLDDDDTDVDIGDDILEDDDDDSVDLEDLTTVPEKDEEA